jgi:hypothetical protein
MQVEHCETPMAACPNQLSFCFGISKTVVPLFLILHGVPLCAQTLEIRLADGRNGHPMAGAASHVNVWVGAERKEAIVIPTGGNGVAWLQLTLNAAEVNIPNPSNDHGADVVANPVVKYDESFRINVPYVLCGSGGSNYSWLMSEDFSTKQILQRGYISPNKCGKATASLKPGQVILFVRPLTWWEKLKE